jgi:hypothetical protein
MRQVVNFKAKRWFVIAGVWAVMGAQSVLLPSTTPPAAPKNLTVK